VEVRSYSLGVLTNGLYVVEADHTIFHRLANLRGGVVKLVGICCDAISGGVRLSDQAARSIG
jgi:hypothetical protein